MAADAGLIEKAIAGDRQAAADLIERHASSVYAACLGLLAYPDRAQDAAQDTLLKGISRLATLQNPSSLRNWLISIAHNLCREAWKQARRRDVGDMVVDMFRIRTASTFYGKLVKDEMSVVYFGHLVRPGDSDKVLMRWETGEDQYRVIFGDLHAETVSGDELLELE